MKRLSIGFLVVFLTLVVGVSATAKIEAVVYPKFSFGGVFGSYYPNCQEWNAYLGQINDAWDMNLSLGSGSVYGLNAAVDISPNIKVRGEFNRFFTETSDYGYDWWYDRMDMDARLDINSFWAEGMLVLPQYKSASGLFLSPYVGGGIGWVSANGTMSASYTDSWWSYYDWDMDDSASDSTMGVRILGGVEGGVNYFNFALEGSYTITSGTELRFSRFGQDFKDDLGGLGVNILLNLKI